MIHSARLRAARLEAGYTSATDFALAIGVSRNTVYRYESGRVAPSSKVLARIARVCGVSMESLAPDEEDCAA